MYKYVANGHWALNSTELNSLQQTPLHQQFICDTILKAPPSVIIYVKLFSAS